MRRWPRSSRCWAAARAPARSSTLTCGARRPGAGRRRPWAAAAGGARRRRGCRGRRRRRARRPWRRRGRGRCRCLSRGEQGQGEPGLGEGVGDGGQEVGGHPVAERLGQAVGEQQADRAGRALGERPRGRVRADVAELVGDLEHLGPQLVGELVRAGERVGHGHATDTDPVGDRLQRHSCHLLSHSSRHNEARHRGRGGGGRLSRLQRGADQRAAGLSDLRRRTCRRARARTAGPCRRATRERRPEPCAPGRRRLPWHRVGDDRRVRHRAVGAVGREQVGGEQAPGSRM